MLSRFQTCPSRGAPARRRVCRDRVARLPPNFRRAKPRSFEALSLEARLHAEVISSGDTLVPLAIPTVGLEARS